jgi:hypothetical protein
VCVLDFSGRWLRGDKKRGGVLSAPARAHDHETPFFVSSRHATKRQQLSFVLFSKQTNASQCPDPLAAW